jgi:sporulation protein YlmC with PRC-barrel domain
MKHSIRLGTIVFGTLLALPVAAQQEKPPDKPTDPPIVQQPPAQRGVAVTAPLLVRVELGPKAIVGNLQGEILGSIEDQVIDKQTGRVLFDVVRAADVQVLVPPDRLTWNEEMHQFQFAGSSTDLEGLQHFDPQALQTLGMGDARTAKPPTGAAEKEKGEAGAPPKAETPPPANKEMKNLLASQVIGGDVVAETASFGKISDLLFDPKQQTIALVMIQPTATSAPTAALPVAPWKALERDEGGRYVLSMTTADLASAPTLERTRIAEMRQEDLAKIQRFYAGKAKP